MAARANVPIVPVAITGTPQIFSRRFPWLGFPHVTVTIGEPFQLPVIGPVPQFAAPGARRGDRERLTEEIMRRIAALLPPEMRGRYSHG